MAKQRIIKAREDETPKETARRLAHLPKSIREKLILMGGEPIDFAADSSGCILTHLTNQREEGLYNPEEYQVSGSYITSAVHRF